MILTKGQDFFINVKNECSNQSSQIKVKIPTEYSIRLRKFEKFS
jgi:hypothetical protein